MTKEGKKYDKDKLMWDLLPYDCLEDIVKILTFGAKKYGRENWKDLESPQERYFAALMRHLISWKNGNKVDGESGENHLSHVIVNALFLLWFDKQNTTENKDKITYDLVLNSGMFFKFYPELTGDWEKDKDKWRKV